MQLWRYDHRSYSSLRSAMALLNVVRNAMKPGNLRVMTRKFVKRFEADTTALALAWARAHAVSIESVCAAVDPDLWRETLHAVAAMEKHATRILGALGPVPDGGGAYPLLHFVVRRLRPQVVVETGVGTGWSSATILRALADNGEGQLLSSDFPYFRLADPERYVGILVPDDLRDRWTLDVRGDEVALPAIVAQVDRIDLFHYDSDKSRSGRAFALDTVAEKLALGATVIMDDIQDNLHFRDLVTDGGLDFLVVEFLGKYVGLVSPPLAADPSAAAFFGTPRDR